MQALGVSERLIDAFLEEAQRSRLCLVFTLAELTEEERGVVETLIMRASATRRLEPVPDVQAVCYDCSKGVHDRIHNPTDRNLCTCACNTSQSPSVLMRISQRLTDEARVHLIRNLANFGAREIERLHRHTEGRLITPQDINFVLAATRQTRIDRRRSAQERNVTARTGA